MKQSNNISVVFFGSSKYSTIDEKALFDAYGLSLVVTTPDGIDTKTKQPIPNPVKQFARQHDIPVITTDKLTPEVYVEIEKYQPDFIVSADIRLILPKKLLALPKKAAINVHHSLLPKLRGPAPVPFAILSGDTTTGVSIIQIAEKVDAGDILAQQTYEMSKDDTTDSVLTKLNELGGPLAVKVIQDFDEYYNNREPQEESKATYSHYMSRQDGYIELNPKSEIRNPKQMQNTNVQNISSFDIRASNFPIILDRAVRAYFPWPGVWFRVPANQGVALTNKIIKLLPGKMVQVEGKKPVSVQDFMNGYPEGKELLEKLQLV